MSRLGAWLDRVLGLEKRRRRDERARLKAEADARRGRVRRREGKPHQETLTEDFTGDTLFCPVCRRGATMFKTYGRTRRRPNALCPWCGAKERHRFACLLLERKTDLFSGGKSLLHVAPEPMLEGWFRERLAPRYRTMDLMAPAVDMRLDLTAMGLADESFDAIYCSHVLEHIVEDVTAMREMRRVLKPGGWALISIPLMAERTVEDRAVTDPAERLRLYMQEDHVRIYGKDFPGRLVEAGFTVETWWPKDFIGPEEREKMALTRACGEIFIARK